MTHYFTDNKDLVSKPKDFSIVFDNETFHFQTDTGVFSKDGLDFGSYVLIKNTYKRDLGQHVLDLGCGYGPVGIIIQRFQSVDVTAVDINSRAVDLTVLNANKNQVDIHAYKCDDLATLNMSFDSIIFNPPIRSGKANIFSLYQKSYDCLKAGGSLYIVINKKHGANSSFKKLIELFSNARVLDTVKGFQVIQAVKSELE